MTGININIHPSQELQWIRISTPFRGRGLISCLLGIGYLRRSKRIIKQTSNQLNSSLGKPYKGTYFKRTAWQDHYNLCSSILDLAQLRVPKELLTHHCHNHLGLSRSIWLYTQNAEYPRKKLPLEVPNLKNKLRL